MIVRRIGPLSFAKISGALYALMGFLFGALISLLSIVGAGFMPKDASVGLGGVLFGSAAIVVLPLCYGLVGFIMSLIGAALYNLVASWVGGIELDLQ